MTFEADISQQLDSYGVPVSIADPSLPDCPLIETNAAFSALTGYARDEAIGKNCRFLQGAHTAPDAVALIRNALFQKRPISLCVANYRKDGSGFDNLLSIACLYRPKEGHLFIGCQLAVDGADWRGSIAEQVDRLNTMFGREKFNDTDHALSAGRRFHLDSVLTFATSYFLRKQGRDMISARR